MVEYERLEFREEDFTEEGRKRVEFSFRVMESYLKGKNNLTKEKLLETKNELFRDKLKYKLSYLHRN